ncbi:hypothetical protein LCGC14_1222440 [marine sediment metagenome]|uniref:Uncharacterized protein n=1 Tax=marine sediment metagenome TaxID=412755 RepID=A0A0F9LY17_9ZZZZ
MSTYEHVCDVCGHSQVVGCYLEFACEQCGQKYEYEEGHCIVLTSEQCRLLRGGPSRCKTCKRWMGPGCPRAATHGRQYRCDHPKTRDIDISDGASDSASDMNIFVGPDFGCVHHEEKE